MWPFRKRPQESDPAPASKPDESYHLGGLLALGVLVLIGYFVFWRGGNLSSSVPTAPQFVNLQESDASAVERCGKPRREGRPIVVTMLYGVDKKRWIEAAADRFARACPNIQVKLVAMGDLESAKALLEGEVTPTLWAPTDELIVNYLDVEWKKRSNEVLLHIGEPTTLVSSPMVMLLWEDRYRALDAILRAGGRDLGPWARSVCALVPRNPGSARIAREDMTPGSWGSFYRDAFPLPQKRPGRPTEKADRRANDEPWFPSLAQIDSWRRVKILHTSPARTASGLEALYLMTYDFVLPSRERTGARDASVWESSGVAPGTTRLPTDAEKQHFARAFAEKKEALRSFLERCESGLDEVDGAAEELTEAMFNVGPKRYDGVITYEHLALPILARIDAHAGALESMRVVYPRPTLMNRHPVFLLRPEDPSLSEEHAAAVKWVGFLTSREIQQNAIELGFRPGLTGLAIRDHTVEANPFLHLRRYGIVLDLGITEPPRLDGAEIVELVRIWEDATGRR